MLYSLLCKIKDHRRGQGRRYLLGDILFFFDSGYFVWSNFVSKGASVYQNQLCPIGRDICFELE